MVENIHELSLNAIVKYFALNHICPNLSFTSIKPLTINSNLIVWIVSYLKIFLNILIRLSFEWHGADLEN